MAEKIGLQAVLELSSFSRAVSQYNSAISGMSKNTASTASSISSSFVGLGSGILKVGAIAAGAGLAGIAALTAGLVLLGSTALTEFAKYERMALSIQSLVARDLAQGKQIEQQRTVAIGLTKKEAQELDGLAEKIQKEELARNTLHARIKEQSEALRQLREAHGEEALDVQTATARLAELENQYNTSGVAIEQLKNRQNELSDTSGRYATVIEKVRTGQMSMTEAMAQAGPKAQELLGWISKLAIQSPFTEEGVNLAFQTALAYGFNVDEAKRLTQAEVDYAAATGKSVDTTNLIALALGQMQAKGKVSGQEIIQLTNAGVGVNKILEDMGFTLDDVSNGLVDADKFIEAVIKDMEIFKGAGAAQANTFSGLISTLSDLKAIGLREFFAGTFTTIQPYLADFVAMLTSAALETGSIRALGDAFGTYVAAGLQKVTQFVTNLTGAFSRFGVRGAAVSLMGMLGFSQEEIGTVSGIIRTVTAEITRLQEVFQKFGASGVAFSIGGLLGLDSDTMVMIQQNLSTIIATVSDFATQVRSFFAGMGTEELQGALLAIGGIVTTGVLAALVAGIMSLVTPFTVLTGAVVLFSAAWAGNWGNIQGITQQAITTITTLFNQFVAIWTANWPIIQAVALTAWEIIKGIFAGFQTALAPVITQLQAQFTQIGTALNQLGIDWSDVWNAIITATKIVAAAIGAIILGIIGVVAGLATGIASGISATITLFQNLSVNIAGIIDGISLMLKGWVDTVRALLQGDLAGVVAGITTVWQGFFNTTKSLFDAMVTIIAGSVDIMLDTLSGFVLGVIDFFKGMYDELVGGSIVPDMINDIVKWFKGLPQKILSALGGLATKISAPFEDVWETIKEALKIDKWVTLGGDLMTGLLEGIKKNSAEVLEFLKNLAYDSLASLKGIWMSSSPSKAFALEAKNAMDGLVVGVKDNTKKVTSAFSGLAQNALDTLMTGLKVTDSGFIDKFIDDLNIGGFLTAANAGGGQRRNFRNILINEISGNMQGLADGTISFMDKINEVAARFQFPPNLAREFARVEGLVGHLTGTFSVMFQKLRIENLAASIGIANNFSSIGSSFADMIQSQIDAFEKSKEATLKLNEESAKLTGTATTQQTQLAKLRTELARLTTGAGENALSIEKITESLAFGERQLEIYRTELAGLAEGSLEWDKKKLAIDKLTESMDMQQKQLEKLTAASDIDLISVQKKQEEIAKLTEEIDANSKAIQANQIAIEAARQKLMQSVGAEFMTDATDAEKIAGELAKIQLLTEFLAGDQNQLTIASKLQTVYGEVLVEQHLDRVKAQEELTKLTAEQARREQEIIRQREAQAKLDSLGQQINLIKLISDRGLNPRDILGGITLGLQAGTTDLLAAANRVVEAMVAQINADLQMGSPSRLMIRIFKQVMAGAAIGMERGQSLLSDAVRSIPILNGSIPQPVFSQAGGVGGSSTTYNYNFPMTVQTAATAPAVVRQYEIKRSMYAN